MCEYDKILQYHNIVIYHYVLYRSTAVRAEDSFKHTPMSADHEHWSKIFGRRPRCPYT